jgi:uncharacterized protein YbjT (DUF2867 family)
MEKLIDKKSHEHIQTAQQPTIAVLGGTGHVGRIYIQEFLSAGFRVRILARSPEHVRRNFPEVEIVRGSMMQDTDAERAMKNADGAFLITPIGGNNNPEPELKAALAAIEGAKASQLPHLIYASQILPEQPTGVAILDAKVEIEKMLESSGVPWSSLCIGCYVDEYLGMAPGLLKLGLLFNPISPDLPLSFTMKHDVARVAIQLLRQGRTLKGTLNVIEPVTRTLAEVAALISQVWGRKVVASGSYPWSSILNMALPLFRRFKPSLASKVILLNYFNKHGYIGNVHQMARVLPQYEITTIETYLKTLSQS